MRAIWTPFIAPLAPRALGRIEKEIAAGAIELSDELIAFGGRTNEIG